MVEQKARATSNGGRASVLRGEGVPVEKIDEAEVYKHQGDYTKLSSSTKWLGSIYSGLST